MGAGDPFSNMAIVLENTWEIITRLEFITKGIDGVDFATTLPLNSINNTYDNFNILKELENRLQNNMKIHSNPANKNRFFRVFYSLHSAKQYTRDGLLPNSLPLDTATKLLKNYAGNNADKVVFHQLFIDGVNDSDTEINGLLKFLDNFELFELRVLRLNSINPEFKESPKFDEIIDCLNSRVRVKIAKSIGSEINAACGQIN